MQKSSRKYKETYYFWFRSLHLTTSQLSQYLTFKKPNKTQVPYMSNQMPKTPGNTTHNSTPDGTSPKSTTKKMKTLKNTSPQNKETKPPRKGSMDYHSISKFTTGAKGMPGVLKWECTPSLLADWLEDWSIWLGAASTNPSQHHVRQILNVLHLKLDEA